MSRTSRLKKRRLTLSALVIFLLLMLTVYQGSGLVRLLMLRATVQVDTIKEDALREMIPVTGMLIKEETLLRSPIKGNIELLVQEGERVSKGEAVAKIQAVSLDTPGGTAEKEIYTPKGGLFSTNIDGLEELINPANLELLSLRQLSSITKKIPTGGKQAVQVDAGQVAAKLIDNLNPLLIYLELPKERIKQQWQPEDIIKFTYQDTVCSGRVVKIESVKDKLLCLLSVRQYPEQLVMLREASLKLITRELSGYLVPEKSLVYRDKQPGLYIVKKQRVRWLAVEVVGILQGQAVIKGDTVTGGLRYITNPQTILEDDYIH